MVLFIIFFLLHLLKKKKRNCLIILVGLIAFALSEQVSVRVTLAWGSHSPALNKVHLELLWSCWMECQGCKSSSWKLPIDSFLVLWGYLSKWKEQAASPNNSSSTGFLYSYTVIILGQIILCCEMLPYAFQEVQQHPWALLLSIPLVVIIKNVSRHCQMFHSWGAW